MRASPIAAVVCLRLLCALVFSAAGPAWADGTVLAQDKGWIAKALRVENPDDLPKDLALPFPTPFQAHVHGEAGDLDVVLGNCTDWQTWRTRLAGTEPPSDYDALRFQGLHCDALRLLMTARHAKRTALPDDLRTLTETRYYPGTLWIALNQKAQKALEKTDLTLADASGLKAWHPDRRGMVLQDAAQAVRLVWLARADFNDDGTEDALYRMEAWVKGGTWTNARLILLTRNDRTSPLTELPLGALQR